MSGGLGGRLKVNRVRVLLSGRTNTMYGEPAMNTAEWSLFLSPWPAVKADDFYHPGFDYARLGRTLAAFRADAEIRSGPGHRHLGDPKHDD